MERIKRMAQEELRNFLALAKDGLRSGAYIYPFQGIAYFLSHPSLYKPMLSKLAPTLSLTLAVTGAMFFFTYIPQAAILALTSGPLIAPFSAALLVLSESSTIISYLAKSGYVFDQDTLLNLFDGTLLSCGNTQLVSKDRKLKSASDPMARLGHFIKKGGGSLMNAMSLSNMFRSLLYLPLNFIPVVGTLMYIGAQGTRIGPMLHARYFYLKGWGAMEHDQWLERNRGAYASFGAAAFVLEMVPFASLFFTYTNTVGAALWAARLEKTFATNPGLRGATEMKAM
ncbi:hypothetical protein TRV_06097 [Trichophyton verrucosum HKI 0517]|uniref:Outer spore wall protein RRT8 n=1 Tax=Trichophyton verrucosum (strain HKI 0517) TaxID=663202 RepID=D4DFZ5_TRIVH|nr:uncharacterized protein TRV_06097 [Trichophyton verrucosum HKI 0517]EFE39185.1 hypothetical protein TRV_06097 [Trichophyton verrucosum HKI 0517]